MKSRLFIAIIICLDILYAAASYADTQLLSKDVIASNSSAIIDDDALLTKALIILRLDGFYDEALALGLAAARQRTLSRRHRYELALIHVSKGRCDLAKPYFRNISAGNNDWMAQDSERFLRQCVSQSHYRWLFDISTGYDRNLALTTEQHTITAETDSKLDQTIRQVESNLSGISISPDFNIGEQSISGWYTDTSAILGYVIPRGQHRYRTNVMLYQRLTPPREYDRRGAGLGSAWQYRTQWALFESRASFKRLIYQRGQNLASIRYQTDAAQVISIPLSDLSYLRLSALGMRQTLPRQPNIILQDQGYSVGYHYTNPQMHGADRDKAWWQSWYAEISSSKRRTTPKDNSSDRLGVTGLVHLKHPGSENKLRFQLNLTKESLIHPRSWRLHPHNLWHVSGKLVFSPDWPDWLDKYPLTLELDWKNTRSKDALDERHRWNLTFRYQFDNANR